MLRFLYLVVFLSLSFLVQFYRGKGMFSSLLFKFSERSRPSNDSTSINVRAISWRSLNDLRHDRWMERDRSLSLSFYTYLSLYFLYDRIWIRDHVRRMISRWRRVITVNVGGVSLASFIHAVRTKRTRLHCHETSRFRIAIHDGKII